MGKVLATLKAQDLYHKNLPVSGYPHEDAAHLVVLKSGEFCRIDLIQIGAADYLTQHAEILAKIRSDLANLASELAPFMPKGMSAAQAVIEEGNAVHTLMPYDKDAVDQRSIVTAFFASEGLQIDDESGETERFIPGWSFSALACTNLAEIGLFAGVVMRLQCVWYQQRGQRDFCIAQATLLARRATVETDITSSLEVIRRLFDFTLWGHELHEFSANLKPWLVDLLRQCDSNWGNRHQFRCAGNNPLPIYFHAIKIAWKTKRSALCQSGLPAARQTRHKCQRSQRNIAASHS